MYGRGRGGWGRGGFNRGAQLQFERYPEIEDLGKARYSESKRQLIKWSMGLERIWKASPYYYESAKKAKKTDIERYSDRAQGAINKKRPLEHYIYMDADHLPGELAKAGGARVVKNVCWDIGFDEAFKKVEEKARGRVNELKKLREADEDDKEDEDDDEVKDNDDEEEEESNDDDGEYIVPGDVDDDEDDFNKSDSDNNDEGDTY